jgi:hypothetical protein
MTTLIIVLSIACLVGAFAMGARENAEEHQRQKRAEREWEAETRRRPPPLP